MGTRSTIKFYDDQETEQEPMVCIYQQYDGYIEGVGHELAEFLKDYKVVNGFGIDMRMKDKIANGMGCLAAQFIAKYKTGLGGFYISNPDDMQEYNYEVRLIDNDIIIKVFDEYDNKYTFEGTPEELLKIKSLE